MATTQTDASRKSSPVLQGRTSSGSSNSSGRCRPSQHMVDYAVDLVRATRPKEPPSPDFVKNWLAWGAGPRAAQNIDPRRQGPGDLARPLRGHGRRHPRDGLPRAAASHLHQLQRRCRRDRRRSSDRKDPANGAGALVRRADHGETSEKLANGRPTQAAGPACRPPNSRSKNAAGPVNIRLRPHQRRAGRDVCPRRRRGLERGSAGSFQLWKNGGANAQPQRIAGPTPKTKSERN